MDLRFVKIILSLFLALLALFYVVHNFANLDEAFASVGYVLGRVDHAVYPGSIVPAVTQPALIWAAIAVIFSLELLTALVLLKGTWNLWQARHSDAMGFDLAKRTTLLGAGLGMIVWFGLFHVFGGALFQQWQTEIGDASLRGAFWFGGIMALTALYISQTPDD